MSEFIADKSTLSQVCFIIIEIIAVLGFLLFAVTGICTTFNAGNFSGCLICAVLFVAVLKRDMAAAIISAALKSSRGRIIVIAIFVIIIAAVLAAVIISVLMINAADRLPMQPETVIVLGCRVKESGPSLMLAKRIDAAYEYLSENESVMCIASGGKGADEPVSEAQCIKERLMSMGIDGDRIIMEDKSENTFQNIRNSLEIMDSLNLPRRAVIVTNEFHQLRASMIASKQGLEAYGKSAPTYLPLLPSYWIREWIAVTHEFIIGRK